jgi:hypothetical protein
MLVGGQQFGISLDNSQRWIVPSSEHSRSMGLRCWWGDVVNRCEAVRWQSRLRVREGYTAQERESKKDKESGSN